MGKTYEEIKKSITTYCGLDCETCEYKEPCHCGGCVATKGNPFHGECPVAQCCLEKGFAFCGECPDLPQFCGVENCEKKSENGFLCPGCEKTTCGILHAYSYTDPDNGDTPPGARVQRCRELMTALAQAEK